MELKPREAEDDLVMNGLHSEGEWLGDVCDGSGS
jgi:hypothetical protein